MAERQPVSDYEAGFIRRTREAREHAGLTQTQTAQLLGTSQGTYKNYETNRLLPHHLIVPFCLATRVEIEWLFTGGSRKKRSASQGVVRAEI